jgi:hypothetical protein
VLSEYESEIDRLVDCRVRSVVGTGKTVAASTLAASAGGTAHLGTRSWPLDSNKRRADDRRPSQPSVNQLALGVREVAS